MQQCQKLPLVIPVLFYTGKRSPYPYSTRWLDEFDDPVLAGNLYSNAFPLVDVTVIPDDDIAGHRSMAALTLLQKHIHQRDLAELVDRLAPILLAGYPAFHSEPLVCSELASGQTRGWTSLLRVSL